MKHTSFALSRALLMPQLHRIGIANFEMKPHPNDGISAGRAALSQRADAMTALCEAGPAGVP